MIISFHGTQKRGHNVGAIAVFAAALESFRTNRKTCMISLRNNIPGENIENFAIPGEESSDDMLNNFSFSDIGIDGLLRRAEIGRLQPEQFDNCVTPLVREKNGFDIIRATKETRLEEALNSKWQFVEEILATANKIYDYVFVYIGSTDNEVVKKMNELSDKVVLVVRQGKREPFPETDKDPAIQKKLCLLVTDFESESVWNFKHIKTEYNIKKNIFTMPHNVKFRDAREDGGLVRFAMKNVNPNRNDFNSFLIYSVKRLLKFCDGNEPDAVGQYTPKYEELEDPLYKEIPEARVLEPYAAEATTETFTEKAGFFSRPKEKTVVKLTEDTSQEVARESDQNLKWKPTNASEQATKLQKEVKVYTEKAEQIALKKAANRMITAPVEEPEKTADNDYDKMFRFADDDDENENEEQEEYEEAVIEKATEEDTAPAAPEVPVVSEKPVEKPIPQAPVKEVTRERPIKKKVPQVEPLKKEHPTTNEKPATKAPTPPAQDEVPVQKVVRNQNSKKTTISDEAEFVFNNVGLKAANDAIKIILSDDEEEKQEKDTKNDLPERFEHVDKTPFDEDDASEVDIPVEDDIEKSEDDIIHVPDEDEDPEAVDETDGIEAEETEVSEEADEEAEDEVSDDDFFIDDIEDDNVAPEADESEDVEDTEDDASEDDFFADDDSDEFINEETDSEVDETEDTDDFDGSEDSDDTTEGNFDDFDEAEDDFTDETEDESDISESLEDDEETEDDFDDTFDDFEDSDDSDDEDVVSYSLGSAADTASDDEEEDTFEDFDDSDEEEEDYVPEASYVLKDDDHKSEMYDTEDTDPVPPVKKQNTKNNLGSEFAWLMDETDDEESDDSYEDDEISDDAEESTDSYEDNDYSDISEDEDSYNEDDEPDNTDDDIDDFDSYKDDDVVTDEDDNAPDDDMGFDEPVEDEEVDAVEDTVDTDSGMTRGLIEKVASLYDDGYRLDMIAKMVGESEDTVRNIRNLSRAISDDYHDGFRLDKIAKRNGISVELAEILNDTAKQFA